jgi:hypothetical protein
MKPHRRFRFLLPILLLLASSAQATKYCVGSMQELAAALSAASQSATNDDIRIEAGTYTTSQSISYYSNPSFTKNLSLSGGWIDFVDPCGFQIPFADATIIDGDGIAKGLSLSLQGAAPGSLAVANLTLRNTLSTVESAGLTVSVSQSNAPQVRISNVAILNAHSTTKSAGLFVSGRADLLIRDVLVANNNGMLNAGLVMLNNDTGPIVLNHATVANNVAGGATSGLYVNAAAPSTISNAIMAGNLSNFAAGDCDFASINQNTTVFNAIINKVCSTLTPASTGILNVDPLFVAAADYHLRGTSPAINSGVANPIGGLTEFDLDGNVRTIGPKPDLGAYETRDSLFQNGFDG